MNWHNFHILGISDMYRTCIGHKDKGPNERQIKAVIYVKEKGKITNREYQEITGMKKRQTTNDLKELEEKGVLEKIGTTGKGTYYVLKGQQRGKTSINGALMGQKGKDEV